MTILSIPSHRLTRIVAAAVLLGTASPVLPAGTTPPALPVVVAAPASPPAVALPTLRPASFDEAALDPALVGRRVASAEPAAPPRVWLLLAAGIGLIVTALRRQREIA